jgi:alanine racemase
MVDCGDDGVSPGDEVVLIGRQGDQEVTAGELAGLIGTIHYEIVCAVSARVPRVNHG